MALSIKHPEADRLAREVAAATGETLTNAVLNSLKERLVRHRGRRRPTQVTEELLEISRRCGSLPIQDDRAADDIIGYDKDGLPR